MKDSEHFDLEELADGVYAAIATDHGYAVSNSGIVDLGGSTLVFDSFLNQRAANDLKETAKSLFGRDVEYLVNSHHHNDHIWGNEVFSKSKIISSKGTRKLMATVGKKEAEEDKNEVSKQIQTLLAGLDRADPDYTVRSSYYRSIEDAFQNLHLILPSWTFEEKLEINGSKRKVEILAYKGGHTESDSILYLPNDGIAFLGDLHFIEFHPWFLDGDVDRLSNILEEIQKLDLKKVVPGHGPIGGSHDFKPMHDDINEAKRIANEAATSGISIDNAILAGVPSKFEGWKFRRFYGQNLRYLYDRFTKN